METSLLRWTIADLEVMPDDGNRYEIIDGELFVSTQPDWHHQFVGGKIFATLLAWSEATGSGVANLAPGVIFSESDAVAPDVVWVSAERLPLVLEADGKLHAAPDLAIELLSPGTQNERRDREAKLKLYSLRGVREYWIVDWRRRQIEVYRREHAALRLVATLQSHDTLESPVLPGFSANVGQFFESTGG